MTDSLQNFADLLSDNFAKASDQAQRLFHGRGHCYPGLEYLSVDWFEPQLFITLFQPPPVDQWQIIKQTLETYQDRVSCAIVQHRYDRKAAVEILWGDPQSPAEAKENDLRFCLDLQRPQNIGYFFDISPARQWLSQHCTGKRVLNLFSYPCAFSVAAMAAQAHSVVNLDMSNAALETGRANHRLNKQDAALKRDVEFLPYNLF